MVTATNKLPDPIDLEEDDKPKKKRKRKADRLSNRQKHDFDN